MNRDGLVLYWTNVLGIKSWIRGTETIDIAFVCARQLEPDETNLLQRMMEAVQRPMPPILALSDSHLVEKPISHALTDDESVANRLRQLNIAVWTLPPLKQMVHGTKEEIQSAKRQAWEVLQNMNGALS